MRNFSAYELVDRETYEQMGEGALALFSPSALKALDDLRDYFGVPVTVNNWRSGGPFQWRGFRTREKATALGSPNSMHAHGKAFDCDIKGITASNARVRILDDQDNPLLRRITRLEAGVNWVHFDLRTLSPGVERIYLFRA